LILLNNVQAVLCLNNKAKKDELNLVKD